MISNEQKSKPQISNNTQNETRSQLIDLLKGGSAHVSLQVALRDLKKENRSTSTENLPYTIWQLTEHIRIAQWDNVEFCRNPKHISPKWPEGYWPSETAPANEQVWDSTVRQILEDRREFIGIIENEQNDLFKPFAHGEGQNLFHEAFLIADHTAYHTGEIVIIRRLLKDWNP